MRWEIGTGVRCDLVAYAAPNFSGKRQVMQLFPTGARKGRIDGDVRSLVVRAFPGTQVVLCASDKDSWELAAWRCIQVHDATSIPSQQRNGLPGVRIPDLAVQDRFDAKKTDTEIERGFEQAERLEDGTSWTFGRGDVSRRVAMIRVHLVGQEEALTDEEAVADAILTALRRSHPDAVQTALDAAVGVLGEASRSRLD